MQTPTEPVIRISYQSSIGESRGAVFETYVPQSASVKHISDILDTMRVVCDRQTAIAKVVELKRAIIADKNQLAACKEDMRRVEEHQMNAWISGGRKGEFQLSKAEAQARLNVEGSVINRQKSIELLEAQLKECEAQIKE